MLFYINVRRFSIVNQSAANFDDPHLFLSAVEKPLTTQQLLVIDSVTSFLLLEFFGIHECNLCHIKNAWYDIKWVPCNKTTSLK